MSEDDRTVWVGNLDPETITEDLLYELFLQAGPLHYVKIPKDKETGRQKTFGFVCFLHDVSVPYAIEFLNGIELLGRTLKVQSRSLQERQRQGLVRGPVGVHTLNPDDDIFSMEPPHRCGQQSLVGAAPHLMGTPGSLINSHMMPVAHQQKTYQQQGQQQSLLGSVPDLLRSMRGPVSNDVIAMARQQMALLSATQPNLFTTNPTLSASHQPTSDRYGSVNCGNRREDNFHNIKRSYEDNRSRGGGPRSIDNASLQDFKSRFDQDREDNIRRLTNQQSRKGNFDFSRLGPRVGHDSGGRYNNNPYQDSGSRYNDSSYHDSGSRHDDRYNRYDNHSQGRHGRSRHDPYSRNNGSRY